MKSSRVTFGICFEILSFDIMHRFCFHSPKWSKLKLNILPESVGILLCGIAVEELFSLFYQVIHSHGFEPKMELYS